MMRVFRIFAMGMTSTIQGKYMVIFNLATRGPPSAISIYDSFMLFKTRCLSLQKNQTTMLTNQIWRCHIFLLQHF